MFSLHYKAYKKIGVRHNKIGRLSEVMEFCEEMEVVSVPPNKDFITKFMYMKTIKTDLVRSKAKIKNRPSCHK